MQLLFQVALECGAFLESCLKSSEPPKEANGQRPVPQEVPSSRPLLSSPSEKSQIIEDQDRLFSKFKNVILI